MMGARQPLGPVATAVEAARQTLSMLRHRRLRWRLLALLSFGAFAYVLGGRVHDRLDGRALYCLMAWWILGTVVVPWSTLLLGVQTVHGEIEDRTAQYLFLRPVGRVPLLVGKWCAVVVGSSIGGALGATVLFVALAARPALWPDGVDISLLGVFVAVLALAAVAYAAVAVLLGATCRRPLAWAAFFVVGVQMLAANLPVSAGLRQLTITDPLRRLILDRIEPDARLARILWPAEQDFRPEAIGEPVGGLLLFTFACVALAAWRYSASEYESRNRD